MVTTIPEKARMKQICKIPDCSRYCHGIGYCKLHYQRSKRGGELMRKFRPPMQHKLSNHPYYTKWANILDRCYNPNCKFYEYYGGRGIGVYNSWRTNAKEFIEYITELDKPTEKHNSIDRIDNNGHYEPGNLRWTTKSIQGFNKRTGKDNVTGAVGVYVNRSKFRARFSIDGKRTDIGSFDTLNEAIEARRKKEQEYINDNRT